MKIKIWPGRYSILKLKIKPPLTVEGFSSFTNALSELSLVCSTDQVSKIPRGSILKQNDGWRVITPVVKLDLGITGFISKISTMLANTGMSIFVVSTFDTDHILVKQENLEKAKELLEELRFDALE